MSDIKTITVNGTQYDIKDATARADCSDLKSAIDNLENQQTKTEKKVESVPEVTVKGSTMLTANTSLDTDKIVVDVDIPADTAFVITITVDATTTGNPYMFVHKSDGSTVNVGSLTPGVARQLFLSYDVKGISFYLSGSAITSSGNLSAVVAVFYDSPTALDFYVEKVKRDYIVKTEDVVNLFTWWMIGDIDDRTGRYLPGADSLINGGYIPVDGGEAYTINDPDKISSSARNAQYIYEYDEHYIFIKKTTLTSTEVITVTSQTKYIRIRSQTAGTAHYVIGNYNEFKTFVYKGSDVKAYVPITPYALTKYQMAKGSSSENLFAGGSILCGGLNYTTGAVNIGNDVIATPLVPSSGVLYWQIFDGKTGDAQFLFEYDSASAFIKYTVLGGTNGISILDSNTRYVRIRTQTNGTSSYTMPTTAWYDEHLVLSSKPITRYQSILPVVTKRNITGDFFDSAIDFSPFEYIKAAADNYVDEICDGAYDVVVPIITDVHSEKPDAYSLHNYIASTGAADVAFNLGDNIPDHYATRAQAVTVLKNIFHVEYYNPRKCEVYALCGNHDYNPVNENDTAYTINQQLFYAISQARTKDGYAESGANYGYIDLDAAKVRIIWLDSGDIFDNETGDPLTTGTNTIVQQKQFTWFCNKALDFMDKADRSDWSVVTLSHDSLSSLSNDGFAIVLKAFMDGTSASGVAYCVGRGSTIPQAYDVDFSTQGPIEYICHLNGHYHDDNSTELGDTGRMQIYIPCDNLTAYYYVNSERTAYTRTPHTIEEHCIDTFCLDKKHRKIYMKRLGVGNDRTFSY